MILFQNSGLYPAYRPRLDRLAASARGFAGRLGVFLADRYGASHFLKPVLDGAPEAFFTNGDDERLQRAWATENGLKASTPLDDILLAQIEAHRADVFYNMDPVRYPSTFVRRLPGHVKRRIAWRAAPTGNADFSAYDLVVNNFPSILEDYRRKGVASAWFAPAHDPEMDALAASAERPVDVVFVGGYSRHHRNRAAVLETVARLRAARRIVFHLDVSRLTRLAETPLGLAGPLKSLRRPGDIQAVAQPAIFGRDLYRALSAARIVLNGAVDMAGADRGNMRCFEATGCGALLLSDAGNYPEGFVDGGTFVAYDSPSRAAELIESILDDEPRRRTLAAAGHAMVRARYSKERQWRDFQALV